MHSISAKDGAAPRDPWLAGLAARADRWAGTVPADPYAPPGAGERFRRRLMEAVQRRLMRRLEARSPTRSWAPACLLLALVARHRGGEAAALDAITAILDRQTTAAGDWHRPPRGVFQVLTGIAVNHAALATGAARYRRAADALFAYCVGMETSANGAMRYVPGRAALLVDTLGMVCPFLAFYARDRSNAEARGLCERQIATFMADNLDPDTRLPFHGYYAGGPYRLGQCGWGRGVGWYLLALVETAIAFREAPSPLTVQIGVEIAACFATLARQQRGSGHWGANVLVTTTRDDSSATAFAAYALARSLAAGLVPPETGGPMLARALAALRAATDATGQVGGSSGEALDLGHYAVGFGPQPWVQGFATAAAYEAAALGPGRI